MEETRQRLEMLCKLRNMLSGLPSSALPEIEPSAVDALSDSSDSLDGDSPMRRDFDEYLSCVREGSDTWLERFGLRDVVGQNADEEEKHPTISTRNSSRSNSFRRGVAGGAVGLGSQVPSPKKQEYIDVVAASRRIQQAVERVNRSVIAEAAKTRCPHCSLLPTDAAPPAPVPAVYTGILPSGTKAAVAAFPREVPLDLFVTLDEDMWQTVAFQVRCSCSIEEKEAAIRQRFDDNIASAPWRAVMNDIQRAFNNARQVEASQQMKTQKRMATTQLELQAAKSERDVLLRQMDNFDMSSKTNILGVVETEKRVFEKEAQLRELEGKLPELQQDERRLHTQATALEWDAKRTAVQLADLQRLARQYQNQLKLRAPKELADLNLQVPNCASGVAFSREQLGELCEDCHQLSGACRYCPATGDPHSQAPSHDCIFQLHGGLADLDVVREEQESYNAAVESGAIGVERRLSLLHAQRSRASEHVNDDTTNTFVVVPSTDADAPLELIPQPPESAFIPAGGSTTMRSFKRRRWGRYANKETARVPQPPRAISPGQQGSGAVAVPTADGVPSDPGQQGTTSTLASSGSVAALSAFFTNMLRSVMLDVPMECNADLFEKSNVERITLQSQVLRKMLRSKPKREGCVTPQESALASRFQKTTPMDEQARLLEEQIADLKNVIRFVHVPVKELLQTASDLECANAELTVKYRLMHQQLAEEQDQLEATKGILLSAQQEAVPRAREEL